MEITIKQFDVSETHFTTHSNQSCNFIQTLMQVTTRSFRVNIKLTLHNNSQSFSEMKVFNNQLYN